MLSGIYKFLLLVRGGVGVQRKRRSTCEGPRGLVCQCDR